MRRSSRPGHCLLVSVFLAVTLPAYSAEGEIRPKSSQEYWTEERCRFFISAELGKQMRPQALIWDYARRYELSNTPYVVWRFAPKPADRADIFSEWTRSLVEASEGRMFKRRPTWEEYLTGRDSGLETYSGRTLGIRIERFEDDRTTADNVATMALTYSHHHRSHLEALTPEQIVADDRLNLPKEKTLKKPVPRYVGSDGWGVTIEFRAFSKDEREKLPPAAQSMALMEGIATGLQVAYHHPELYHLPIFQTFGDEDSMALYGGVVRGRKTEGRLKLGFTLNEENTPADQPITAYGTQWWDLQATPARLEEWVMQQKSLNIPYNALQSSHEVRLPNGANLKLRKGGRYKTDLDGIPEDASTLEEAQVGPGIYGKGEVMWEAGHLLYLSKTTRPFKFQAVGGPVEFPAESMILAVPPKKGTARATGEEFGKLQDFKCVRLGAPATIHGVFYPAGVILVKRESGQILQLREKDIDFCQSNWDFFPGAG